MSFDKFLYRHLKKKIEAQIIHTGQSIVKLKLVKLNNAIFIYPRPY